MPQGAVAAGPQEQADHGAAIDVGRQAAVVPQLRMGRGHLIAEGPQHRGDGGRRHACEAQEQMGGVLAAMALQDVRLQIVQEGGQAGIRRRGPPVDGRVENIRQ